MPHLALNYDEKFVTLYRDGQVVRQYHRLQPEPRPRRRRQLPLDPTVFLSSKLKIARAKKHLTELQLVWATFLDADSYQGVTHQDGESGDTVYTVRSQKVLPIEISAIFGDAIHNLRSALDVLVCDLIRNNGADPKNGGFPLDKKAKAYASGALNKFRGLSPRAERLLLAVKANPRWNDQLHLLALIENFDKHSHVQLTAVAVTAAFVQAGITGMCIGPDGTMCIGGGGTPFTVQAVIKSGLITLEDETELHRTPAYFHEELNFAFGIVIAQGQFGEGVFIEGFLMHCIDLVERVVALIEKRGL